MNTQKIITIYAVAGALVGLGTYAYAFGDFTGLRPWWKYEQDEFTKEQFQTVMDQTQQNARIITQFKFDELWGRRKLGELTWDEKMALCSYALTLNYTVVDDQNRAICDPQKGTPILTFRQ